MKMSCAHRNQRVGEKRVAGSHGEIARLVPSTPLLNYDVSAWRPDGNWEGGDLRPEHHGPPDPPDPTQRIGVFAESTLTRPAEAATSRVVALGEPRADTLEGFSFFSFCT